MSNTPSRITVDIQQIAEIAGVGRSAVGNWRKRHDDFPIPDASGGFDLSEVEGWLLENDKIDTRVSPEVAAWALADSMRSNLFGHEATAVLIALAVYLHACQDLNLFTTPTPVQVSDADRWSAVRDTPKGKFVEALIRAGRNIESSNEALSGLIAAPLERAHSLEEATLRQLLDSLDQSEPRDAVLVDFLEHAVSSAGELDRFRGAYSTPDDVAELMVRLVGHRDGTVVDPACGHAGLLLSVAVHPDRESCENSRLVGYDVNDEALLVARSRCFLYGVTAEFHLENVFRVPVAELPKADVVLLDPPFGLSDWGDAEVYGDDRWTYGLPPRKSADLAWVQLALQALADDGRAVVVTSTGPTFRGGTEAQIRDAMIRDGVVEAMIQLPGRMRADTSIPLVLWVLRPPSDAAQDVVFVDASALGSTGRSQHTFGEADLERIVAAVSADGRDGNPDADIAWSVSLPDVLANGAVLEPGRYRPAPEVDLRRVRERAEAIRAKLPAASAAADAAVGELLSRLTPRPDEPADRAEKPTIKPVHRSRRKVPPTAERRTR